jgi:hypothetical protein
MGTNTSKPNEANADRGMAAISAGARCEHRLSGLDGLGADITEHLADIRHLCDRYGLDYGVLDRRGYREYLADQAEHPVADRRDPTSLTGARPPVDEQADVDRRSGYVPPDGRPFSWGEVLAVHTIAEYTIVEYTPVRSGNVSPADHDPSPMFHCYIGDRDTSHTHDRLDLALAHCIAFKYDGLNTRADRYFARAIRASDA